MKGFPESGRTQLYARDLATGKPGDVYPLRCVPSSDLLVAAGCEAEGRGGEGGWRSLGRHVPTPPVPQ